jgi:hypothetical protein
MQDFVFVAHKDDALANTALSHLAKFGAKTSIVTGLCDDMPVNAIALFSSAGRYPSKYFRLVKPKDEQKRCIAVPDWAESLSSRVALNVSRDDPKGLYNALLELHKLYAPRVQAPAKNSGRKNWRSGHQARRREFHNPREVRVA